MSERKLNIAFVTDMFYPDGGGIVTCLNIMIGELERRGHEITVYTHKRAIDRFNKKNVKIIGFPSLELPSYPGFYFCIPNILKFRKLLIAQNPDIVHLHTHASPLTVAAMVIAKRKKIPIVATHHSFLDRYEHYLSLYNTLKRIKIPFGGKFLKMIKESIPVNLDSVKNGFPRGTELRRRIIWQFVRTAYNRCNLVIVPSKLSAKKVEAHKISCVAVPYGVDFDTFRTKKSYARTGRILSVCRLGKEKNLDVLFRAFSLFVKKFPEAKLTVVGDGPARESLVNLMKSLGLEGSVSFEGMVKRSKLQEYFETHDFLANASDSETFGYVTAEAMAGGLPIVAVNAQGSNDLVKPEVNGFLAKPNNVEDFAWAMEKMMDKKTNLKRMGTASRRLVQKFSVKKCVDSHVRLYMKLSKKESPA